MRPTAVKSSGFSSGYDAARCGAEAVVVPANSALTAEVATVTATQIVTIAAPTTMASRSRSTDPVSAPAAAISAPPARSYVAMEASAPPVAGRTPAAAPGPLCPDRELDRELREDREDREEREDRAEDPAARPAVSPSDGLRESAGGYGGALVADVSSTLRRYQYHATVPAVARPAVQSICFDGVKRPVEEGIVVRVEWGVEWGEALHRAEVVLFEGQWQLEQQLGVKSASMLCPISEWVLRNNFRAGFPRIDLRVC